MKSGKVLLSILTATYLLAEIVASAILLNTGDVTPFECIVRVCLFLLFILLFAKKLTWARWVLSVLLVLYGLAYLIVGLELAPIFYAIGSFFIFFGIYIHTAKDLEVYRTKNTSHKITEPAETTSPTVHETQPYLYPTLLRRYQALLIDGMLLLFTLIVIMVLIGDSKWRTPLMLSIGGTLLLTYEPFLTTYSRTIGQRLMNIRVGRREDPMERINLLSAYIRWFTKALLGWISFTTVVFNPERRAIHDFASDSVMINEPKKNTATSVESEKR